MDAGGIGGATVKMKAAVMVFLTALTIPANGATVDAWHLWSHELRRMCPSHHVEWEMDAGYDDLIADFERTLSSDQRHQIEALAGPSRSCTSESLGFACEMSASLDAYRRLGLLGPRLIKSSIR